MTAWERALVGFGSLSIILVAFFWVSRLHPRFQRLLILTTLLTFVLIVLGAYVRLSDAGLGCPDWPGCYGNLTPHHSASDIQQAEAVSPGGPVSMAKAWKEMVHRYLAMIVGSLIAALMFSAWRNRQAWPRLAGLTTVTSVLVIFQAALGAWTVTMLLRPAIVTSHLIGGIAILTMLVWMYHRLKAGRESYAARGRKPIIPSGVAWLVLLILGMQIVLGGWVSTNYAALACSDLPQCNGAWFPTMDFANAFHVIRPLGVGPDGTLLTIEALRAIHWTHRVGAIITTLAVGAFGWALLRRSQGVLRTQAAVLLALLLGQVSLGLANVAFALPLPIAVAHNGVAALLFATLFWINLRLTCDET